MRKNSLTILIFLTIVACSTENPTSEVATSTHLVLKSGNKEPLCSYGSLNHETLASLEKGGMKDEYRLKECKTDTANSGSGSDSSSLGLLQKMCTEKIKISCVDYFFEKVFKSYAEYKKNCSSQNTTCPEESKLVHKLTQECIDKASEMTDHEERCKENAKNFINEKKNQTKKNTTIEIKQYPAPLPR